MRPWADLADAVVWLAIVAITIVAMEAIAWVVHRHWMHGRWGWRVHRSHHEPRKGVLELNDLHALAPALIVTGLFRLGADHPVLVPIAVGATLYGLIYVVVHDGLVHRRWPFRHVPRKGYLKRLYQAHLLHHASHGREGAVSFGFLYAPPIRQLHARRRRGAAAPGAPLSTDATRAPADAVSPRS